MNRCCIPIYRLAAIALFTFAIVFNIVAQNNGLSTATRSFSDRFRTIQAHVDGNDQLPPIISFKSNDRIVISFDELAEEHSNLQYSLIHCNAEWKPDNLVESEFLDGFNYAEVGDFQYSRSTTVHYVNYRIILPNENMMPLVSGNYLLYVYRDDNPETKLLQVRFQVSEQAVGIYGNVETSTDIDHRARHQQLNIEVDGGDDLSLDDLSNRLIVVVQQNARNDNSTTITHPQFITGKRAHYSHLRPLIFPAGNEYRRFETVSTLYPGMNIEQIDFANGIYHMKVHTDSVRATSGYSYDITQKGRFRIREYNSADADTEADYVMTHFELKLPGGMQAPLPIYIDGDLGNRVIGPETQMRYQPSEGVYRTAILLKQGSYNYQYIMPDLKSSATAGIEGDFYQTDNEYTVSVYYRQPGKRYDRLLGTAILKSAVNNNH
ncbi:DUF5103 domain-containing protein [uncultured Muribaculum sp.]|uniref:type IX secretion system plug protein n=1 Tax=uncultured Muribaculum sp. TaxID=1918613 RepID=UPI002583C070|nr:DUF5103 domain-containing protein [uncultured Muribaculum sp.]